VDAAEGIPPAYRAYIRYQYCVDGVTYESTRLRFGGVNPFSYLMASSELARSGAFAGEVKVYYDTHAPGRACLITGANEWTLLLPIVLLVFGAAMLVLGVWRFVS
jgi:hypothetical protein